MAAQIGGRIAAVLPDIIDALIAQAKAGDCALRVQQRPSAAGRCAAQGRARTRPATARIWQGGIDVGSLAAPLTLGIEHKHGPRRRDRHGPWNGLDNGYLQDHCRVLR